MTEPTYSINSITVHGVSSNWERVIKRKKNNGVVEFQPIAINTWNIQKMPVATFLLIQEKRGAILDSLGTNDIDEKNEAATYTTAEMTSLTNGQHVGTIIQNVRLEFRVDVS